MRVIAISSALDSPHIPESVARYVLYHELLHLELGIDTLHGQHDPAFRRAERLYPRWHESEAWLKRIASG
jgi:predicted metal-dependent hydrolase